MCSSEHSDLSQPLDITGNPMLCGREVFRFSQLIASQVQCVPRSSILQSVWEESHMTMASLSNQLCKFVKQNITGQPRGLLDL